MTLDLRLQALMRRRGIKSQSHLARLSGVSQSSIHRILLASPGYTPTRTVLMRLARTLDTSISWLSEGAADLHWPGRSQGADASDHTACGPQHEWHRLFARLPHAEREALLAIARLMQQRQPAVGPPPRAQGQATGMSMSVSSAPAGYPPALEPYEVYPIE